jgi:hypothetical protein
MFSFSEPRAPQVCHGSSFARMLSFASSSRKSVERNLVSRIAQVVHQLEVERDRMQKEAERLAAAIDALNAASGDYLGRAVGPRRGRRSRRGFSAATRARMAAAQRARRARARRQPVLRRLKRASSQSARNRIAAAQRARWAKLKQKRSQAKPQQRKST